MASCRSRRRSPVHGCHLSLFDELVSLPTLAAHPSLTFEVVLTRVEEHRLDAPARDAGASRGASSSVLIEVLGQRTLNGAAGLASALPDGLADAFTTADVAVGLGVDRALAQRIAYTLRMAGVIELSGKRGGARVPPLPLRSRNAAGVVSRSAGRGRRRGKTARTTEDHP